MARIFADIGRRLGCGPGLPHPISGERGDGGAANNDNEL